MSMSNQAMADAIYDKIFEDISPRVMKAPEDQPDMVGILFRHSTVKKIREVLEKSSAAE